MNNGKLCAMIVTLCLVVPLMVGYAWPSSSGTEVTNDLGDTINISEDIKNSDIGIYAAFNDPFANNMNVFNKSLIGGLMNLPVTVSDTYSSVKGLQHQDFFYTTVTADEHGFYTIDPQHEYQRISQSYTDVYGMIFLIGYHWDEIDLDGGVVANRVIYYPDSDMLAVLTPDQYNNIGDFFYVPYSQLTFTGGTPESSVMMTYILLRNNGQYAQIEDGFKLDTYGTGYHWHNGYSNQSVDILLKPSASSEMNFAPRNAGDLVAREYINLTIDANGDVTGSLTDAAYSQSMGNISQYPYWLISINAVTQTVKFCGLKGMENFLSDYDQAVRVTYTAAWDTALRFDMMSVRGYGDISWYVPMTISNYTTAKGTHYYSVDLKDYYGGDSQVQIRSPQLWPTVNDGLRIVINDTEKIYGTVDLNGVVTWRIRDQVGTFTTPLNNLIITDLGKEVYLNGSLVYTSDSTISSFKVRFIDDWLTSLYFVPITHSTHPTYTWLPGGFGLDVNGFCMVGLMTSFGSSTAAVLHGKRSGVRTGLVAFTAAACGAVYLIIMMGGLT